jgi:hypothetical protein
MKKSSLVLSVFLAAAPLSAAYADSITGSIGNANASYDLNDYGAFAYYGNTGAVLFSTVSGTPSTDLANLADFTVLSSVAPAGKSSATAIVTSGGAGNTIVVTYTNGTTPPQASESNSNGFYTAATNHSGNNNGVSGVGFSLTTKLFAPTETFQFLLENFDTASDLTASLNDAGSTSLSLTDAFLPQLWSGQTFVGPGDGNTDGLLTLTVNGAIGQTLTFTDVTDFTGVSNTAFGNIGLEAITVSEVPEPATCALMGAGCLLLVWRLRRKSGMA